MDVVCLTSEAPVRKFAVALLFAALAFTAFAHADDWSKTYELTGKPELRVDAWDAHVRIEPWDQNKIEAHVTTRGWQIGGSGIEIVDHQQGNAVDIELHSRSHHISYGVSFGIGSRRIDLEIHMPRSAKVDIHTSDGSIDARGLGGDLKFSSGDGRLTLSDLDGVLRAHTRDGSVHASGRFDLVELRTGDGHVELEARPSSQLRENWEVRTSDGSVRLTLPANLAANLNLHTGDGRITTDFPITVQGSYDKSDLRGTINGGGKELTVHTGDGSITLQKS
jgi:DUF4097 and DUF4098 domain-containing protein YvlB